MPMLSRIPNHVLSDATRQIKAHAGQSVAVEHFAPASGGCINNGGRLDTTAGPFFIKWNSASQYPGMFAAEAKGLALLRDAECLAIPSVVAHDTAQQDAYLVLSYIEAGPRQPRYWENLGHGLAAMHRQTHHVFGLGHDNYIGSLPQSNRQHDNWLSFFVKERVAPQVALARRKGLLGAQHGALTERLYEKLPSLLPAGEKPALIHGDLWSGNLITGTEGEPCLIDPAVYYGNREVELAFTALFGGFDQRFYDSYQEAFPLLPGYANRMDLYNLYPLLVHANLFGGGYVAQATAVLSRYAS